jgi:hypothetical protein
LKLTGIGTAYRVHGGITHNRNLDLTPDERKKITVAHKSRGRIVLMHQLDETCGYCDDASANAIENIAAASRQPRDRDGRFVFPDEPRAASHGAKVFMKRHVSWSHTSYQSCGGWFAGGGVVLSERVTSTAPITPAKPMASVAMSLYLARRSDRQKLEVRVGLRTSAILRGVSDAPEFI